MTTDNRANEPNKYAGFLARQEHLRDPWRGIGKKCLCGVVFDSDVDHAMHQVEAILEAALVAAQGAAPQAEVLPETGNELRDADGDLISSGKHLRVLHQGGYVCDTCTNVLGINVRWDHAVKRNDHAPVLPSGGVDEDKLAEVRREAAEKAWSEGHAAGRDYQGDGWNCDAHDPEEDNPYRAEAYRQERGEQ